MPATTATPLRLDRPADAARELAAANDRLARRRDIGAEERELVAALGAAVGEAERWEETIDPYLVTLLHRGVIQAQHAVATDDRDELRLALARVVHALSAIADAEPVSAERTAKEVAQWLARAVPVPQRRLAELLGVDLRRFQRWISERETAGPEGDDARRVRAVAALANQLRHALTADGVVDWFDWPQRDLGGRTPRELLDDPLRLPDLLAAAGAMRATYLA